MNFQQMEYVQGEDGLWYGTPRHSGRYPWGSGKNPQRNKNFLTRAKELEKQGLSQKQIAESFGLSTNDFRAYERYFREQEDMKALMKAQKLKDKQWSNTAIAAELGVTEGTIRNWLDPNKQKNKQTLSGIAENLSNMLQDKPYLDIGEGVHRQLGISETQLEQARVILKDQGYNVYDIQLPQASNPKQKTTMQILCDGETTRQEVFDNIGEVTSPDGLYFKDYGETPVLRKPIESVDSSRVAVRYDEQGGTDSDGTIEIRPGVEDLTLGQNRYAQVRIAVDDSHYLKGMAHYATEESLKDWPDGVDIMFNTNKHEGTPMLGDGDSTVLKQMKSDPQNPFGASFRQWDYEGSDGEMHTSPINIVNDNEDWDRWANATSSQFLSKQFPSVAGQQLDKKYNEFEQEFNEIKDISNPTIRKEMMDEFASKCDSAAVDLKGASFPRQSTQALMPVNSLGDHEVYAPMYENGEEVILIRHPHAGTFEIPRLTVNNNNQEGIDKLGQYPEHAIGVNPKTRAQLSGADCDGDTVLVIPTKGQNFKTAEAIDELVNFNPSDQYARNPDTQRCTGKSRDGMVGDSFNKGMEMGKISNLITDMTVRGAELDSDEIVRAVKHSMVVIDAEKHNLDWQKSYQDNRIQELVDKYQPHEKDDGSGGASTLISRAKSEMVIPERKEITRKNDMTPEELERYNNGEKIYRNTNRTYKETKQITDPSIMTEAELERYNKGKKVYRETGKVKEATEKVEKLDYVDDAHELSSGTVIEKVYADHSNRLKSLANEARKESRNTQELEVNKSAKEIYKDEVESLNNKIVKAELEAPKERQAQAIAKSQIDAAKQANPDLNSKENADKLKKISSRMIEQARDLVYGSAREDPTHKRRYKVTFSDREVEAINAGAISKTSLKKLLKYADKNELKQQFTPKKDTGLSTAKKNRALQMLRNGAPMSEITQELGVSRSTLAKEINLAQFNLSGG